MISINYQTLSQERFPDGTLSLKTPKFHNKDHLLVIWNYENDAELFTLICVAKKFANNPKKLFMPYLPHARMDRVKNPDTEVFTLKYFCEVINSLNFDAVVVVDAHSNVGPALLNNCENFPVKEELNYAIQSIQRDLDGKDLMLFFPDEGAMKRYSDYSPLPYSFGIKQRDWETGKITSLRIEGEVDVAGRDVLIVDDICSYGGTFFRAAQALKDAGARHVYLYVTHCEENILKGSIFNDDKVLIDGIYTTTSMPALFSTMENMNVTPWISFI